tara:strand:+ start:205 stop:507 length:303 start_codon:yes stop_codon:yes gene_type:complete
LDYYIGQAGIMPDIFWKNTWKENQLLGESHMIKSNMQWEQVRYIASMLYNVNCNKKAQMITPDKLFPLPQDVYLQRGKPKSTKDEMIAFKKLSDSKKPQK